MEIKSFPFELKATDDNTFEGYAGVFRNKDSYGDVIEPGAFSKTIKENANRIKVLWQHDPWSPIGKPLHMEEDNHGLYVKAQVSQTSLGKDVITLLRDGVITEMSIGYSTIKDEWDNEQQVRKLKELKLWEFSPVTFAANDQAIITGVKNLDDLNPLLMRAQWLTNELKAGRVLSDKNRKLVEGTMASLEEAISALKALLDAAEPSDDTPGSKGAAHNNPNEPGNHSEEIKQLAQEILLEAELKSILKEVSI